MDMGLEISGTGGKRFNGDETASGFGEISPKTATLPEGISATEKIQENNPEIVISFNSVSHGAGGPINIELVNSLKNSGEISGDGNAKAAGANEASKELSARAKEALGQTS